MNSGLIFFSLHMEIMSGILKVTRLSSRVIGILTRDKLNSNDKDLFS